MMFFIFAGIAYLLGSIPTAVWVGKSVFGLDIREHGSKNAGATNTFRVLGKKPGIIVLLVDILKGVIAVLLPILFRLQGWENEQVVNYQLVAALSAVLGHLFPIFAQFKGGKGVATSLGVIIGIHPMAAGICLLVFLITFIVFKYVSLGAILSALSFPFLIEFVFHNEFVWLRAFSILLSVAVIITHHKNIKRLLRGTENKMNLFKN